MHAGAKDHHLLTLKTQTLSTHAPFYLADIRGGICNKGSKCGCGIQLENPIILLCMCIYTYIYIYIYMCVCACTSTYLSFAYASSPAPAALSQYGSVANISSLFTADIPICMKAACHQSSPAPQTSHFYQSCTHSHTQRNLATMMTYIYTYSKGINVEMEPLHSIHLFYMGWD